MEHLPLWERNPPYLAKPHSIVAYVWARFRSASKDARECIQLPERWNLYGNICIDSRVRSLVSEFSFLAFHFGRVTAEARVGVGLIPGEEFQSHGPFRV